VLNDQGTCLIVKTSNFLVFNFLLVWIDSAD
jgi:hypothetical protein